MSLRAPSPFVSVAPRRPRCRGTDHVAQVDPAACSSNFAVAGTAATEVSEAHERSGSSPERSASSTMSEASFGKVAPSDRPARHRERAAVASTDPRVSEFRACLGRAGEDVELAELSDGTSSDDALPQAKRRTLLRERRGRYRLRKHVDAVMDGGRSFLDRRKSLHRP